MKRVILLLLFTLGLPAAALANSITVDYQGYGTLSAGTASLGGGCLGIPGGAGCQWIVNMQLVGINSTQGNLGTINITTGVETAGCGGFCFTGGSVTIWNNSHAVLFHGTFASGSIVLSSSPLINGFNIQGTLSNGLTVATQVFAGQNGNFTVSSDTIIVTPEPSTLGMLGTGLLSIAGLMRQKARG